jgi:hypothetical protein
MPVRLQPEVIEESVPTSVPPPASDPGTGEVWGKYSPPVDGGDKSKPSRLLLSVVIVLVALTVAAVGVVGKQMYSKSSSNPRTVTPDDSVIPTDTPAPTPSPTPEITSKDKVKIQILNGSGITGQAGKIGTILEKADFTAPEAGNADTSDQIGTIIEYTPKLDMKIVEEVAELMKQSFKSVEIKSNPALTTYHLVITTGQDPQE